MPTVHRLGAGRSIDAVLRATELLRGAEERTIEQLAAASTRRTLDRDQVLFLAGDEPASVYAVADGLLRVFTTSWEGDEPTFTVLSPGALVGELGVIDGADRSASVAAMRRAEVIEIPAAAFLDAYHRDGSIARRLVALLSGRVRELSDSFADLTSLDLGGRVAKYLITQAEQRQAPSFALTLTQGEIGQLVGGARQTVNQVLQSLERAGLIKIAGRNVEVLDLARLRRRALTG